MNKPLLSILIPSKTEPNILKMLMALEEEFPEAQIITANDRYGKGKGWAVRTALQMAQGEFIIFIDGDMDIHPRMIHRLLPFLFDYDIVLGKKQIRGHFSRRLLTFFSRIYINILFGMNYDTQTGIKAFRKDALEHWFTDGFMFDLEIISRAMQRGKTIIEVPVEVSIERKMGLRSVLLCLWESLKILGILFERRNAN